MAPGKGLRVTSPTHCCAKAPPPFFHSRRSEALSIVLFPHVSRGATLKSLTPLCPLSSGSHLNRLQADASLYCSIACKVSAGVNMVPPADGTSGGVEASGGEGVKKERGGATAGKVAPLSRGTGRLSKQDQQLGSVTSEAVDSVGRGRGGRGERVGNGQTPVKAEEHEGDNSPEVTPRTRGVKRSAASGPVTPGLQGRLPAPLVGSSSGKKSRNGSGSEGGSEGRGGRLAGVGVDSASLRLLQMGNRRKGHPRKSPDC